MVSAPKLKPTRVKMGEHRARLRAQGLRPIQIWVADDQAFIDAVSDWDDE